MGQSGSEKKPVLTVGREEVFRFLRLSEEDEAFREASGLFDVLRDELLETARPVIELRSLTADGALIRASAPKGTETRLKEGDRLILAAVTVGEEVSERSGRYFAEGAYLKGLMADAMADAALFSMTPELLERVHDKAEGEGLGVLKRMEAPADLSMAFQRAAFRTAFSGEDGEGSFRMNEAGVLLPAKSMLSFYLLTEDRGKRCGEHSCAACNNTDCPMRRPAASVRVTVLPAPVSGRPGAVARPVTAEASGVRLIDALLDAGVEVRADCGGGGICGKCGVRFLSGAPEILDADRTAFSEKSLRSGWRLACVHTLTENAVIAAPETGEQEFLAVTAFREQGELRDEASGAGGRGTESSGKEEAGKEEAGKEEAGTEGPVPEGRETSGSFSRTAVYDVALDIGTTTIAALLMRRPDGTGRPNIAGSAGTVNRQRLLGADVMSRIRAGTGGKGALLQSLVRESIDQVIRRLLSENGAGPGEIGRVAAAGNTVMLHLLTGRSVEGLGAAPFRPVTLALEEGKAEDILGEESVLKGSGASIFLLPGISAYVGADITAGLYAVGMHEKERPSAFIDLGTNGEMAVGSRDGITVTSTAAGPAFEGGNISCGVGSIPGAVSGVDIRGRSVYVRTIGKMPPEGICGTGLIEAAAEFLKNGIIDGTGRMSDLWFGPGYPLCRSASGEEIRLTQKDIRELQLAKAAVRAGFDTLLEEAGVSYGELGRLYLAGGFGFALDLRKAAVIGLIPEELLPVTEAAGNSALAGAARFLRRAAADGRGVHAAEEEVGRVVSLSAEKALGGNAIFERRYLGNMEFRKSCDIL